MSLAFTGKVKRERWSSAVQSRSPANNIHKEHPHPFITGCGAKSPGNQGERIAFKMSMTCAWCWWTHRVWIRAVIAERKGKESYRGTVSSSDLLGAFFVCFCGYSVIVMILLSNVLALFVHTPMCWFWIKSDLKTNLLHTSRQNVECEMVCSNKPWRQFHSFTRAPTFLVCPVFVWILKLQKLLNRTTSCLWELLFAGGAAEYRFLLTTHFHGVQAPNLLEWETSSVFVILFLNTPTSWEIWSVVDC